MKHPKSQASLEFVTIFGIAFTLLLIISFIFFGYLDETKNTLDQQQLEKIGSRLMADTNKIFFLGEGNRVTVNANFPEDIQNITIHHLNSSGTQFDFLNITYYNKAKRLSDVYEANQEFIRFNCTRCYHHSLPGAAENVSYFNLSDFSGGPKKVRVESRGLWVSIDFLLQE